MKIINNLITKEERKNSDKFRKINIFLLIIGFLLININFVLAATSQTFGGGGYVSSFSGQSMNVVGSSLNPQFNNPNFFNVAGFTSTSDYWPKFEKENCYERQDFIMQIAPGGCSPAVVRSDLLEEQNVPVFCKVMAIKTNPLIDVSKIRSLHFDKDYPPGVSSISYFPARAAFRSTTQLISSPLESNLGYLVIVLKQTSAERDMPEFVEGNVTATIDYDVEGAFGIGNTNFYVSEMNDEEWLRDYKEYGFWNGKAYVRVESVESDRATISIYKDAGQKQSTVTLRKGETSKDIYLGGFYCAAGMNIRLNGISAPVESALLQINDEQIWVSKGDYFLNKKCRVNDLEIFQGGGKLDVICFSVGKFSLSLNPGKAKLTVGEEPNKIINEFAVGEKINFNGIENIWLGYVGQDYEKKDFVILIKDELSTTEREFADKNVYSIIEKIVSESDKKIDSLKKDIESKIKDQYKKKLSKVSATALKGVKVGIIKQDTDKEIFGVKLEECLVAKDKDWSEEKDEKSLLAKEYYDESIKNYQDLFDFYPNENRIDGDNEDSYAAQGLYEAALLAKEFGMNEQANEFYTRLLRDYPNSFIANQALREKIVLMRYDTTDSKAVVNVNNDQYFVSLLDFKSPEREKNNAVLLISGKEETLGLGDSYGLKNEKGESLGSIQLKEIKYEQITLKYDKSQTTISSKVSPSISKTIILKTIENENQEIFGGINVKLVKINVGNQVKISITPKSFGPRTESSFNFKVGIEKRAIKLSPEKTQEMINNLDEQLERWTSLNVKLGKVVKGLKAACFATSAIFTVKNLFSGFGGEAMARNTIMTGVNGWNDYCQDLVEGKKSDTRNNNQVYSSVQECLLANGDRIKQSVNDYKTMLNNVNNKMETIQDSVGTTSNDILDFQGSVDSEKVKNEFCKNYFQSYYSSNKDTEFTLSDGREIVLRDIISQEKVNDCDVSLSNMRDLYSLGQLQGKDSVANDVMKGQLSKDLLYTYESNQYDSNYDVLKQQAGAFLGERPQPLSLSGDNIAYTPMNTLTNTQAETWNSKGASGIVSGDKVVTYNVPLGATFYTKEGENRVENLKKEDLQGKTVMIVLHKEGSGSKYIPREAYKIEEGKTLIKVEKSSSLFAYLDERGATKFIEANTKAYQNKIENPASLSVKYFERDPYKGLPAEVPFDVENGWYVELTYVLSGFGKPYEESGRAVNFYICNVGENGKIEFKKSRDDICRYYNGNTASLNFPGMSLTESNRLVSRAQDAIAQAAKQSGKTNIVINGQSYRGGVSLGGEEGSCSDFMSPEDCRILFNVCDPVMCPPSRCDLGGKFRVDNVVQTGIIGSLTLCLPNFREGIMIPICLSGVHAGIEGYISILNSTRQCLKESLETGRNIGICDEIKSVYMCEFFWKQAAPFLNVIIPRLVESFYNQGARGGGEYLTVQASWDNMQNSIDYFKNDYAVNSMNAFNTRSTEEIGTEICKSFMSVNVPTGNMFDTLIEPDSPEQYSAWFSESGLTSTTIPATSHYKVYYHIYAGNDQGVSYVVYLKDLPESNYIHTMGTYIVDRGYIARGGSVDQAKDFSSVSGYKQLCISINGKDQCGFGKVSTSYFVNRLTDEYAKEQSSQVDIKKEEECVAGTSSILSLVQPNLQAGAGEVINPELYNHGIIRVCSTFSPGKQVTLLGEYDTTNSSYDRWKDVGYCDDPKIRCWLDTNSVKDVITHVGIEEQVLEQVDMNVFGEGYWDQNKSDTEANRAQEFVDKLSVKGLTKDQIDSKIAVTVETLTKLTNLGVTNRYRARGLFLLGRLYSKIASAVKPGEVREVVNEPASATHIVSFSDSDYGFGDKIKDVSGEIWEKTEEKDEDGDYIWESNVGNYVFSKIQGPVESYSEEITISDVPAGDDLIKTDTQNVALTGLKEGDIISLIIDIKKYNLKYARRTIVSFNKQWLWNTETIVNEKSDWYAIPSTSVDLSFLKGLDFEKGILEILKRNIAYVKLS